MSANKKIRDIAFWITVGSLVLLVVLGNYELTSIYYDISLAVFGSSVLSCLTAQISYNSDIRKINRAIISNVLHIQSEVKKILAEYNKVLDNWNENDFYEVNSILSKLIGEFFSYFDTIKFETGKDVTRFIKVVDILEIYQAYIDLNGKIRAISGFLKNQNKESAFKEYRECVDIDKEIVEKITALLKKEYGKNFSDINTIGLL